MPALLVFGARNLGRAVATRLAADGWDVAAVARSRDSLDRLASEIPAALAIQADAAEVADIERAFAQTRERFGSVDLVVVAISPSTRGRAFGGGTLAESDAESFAPYTDDLLPALFNVMQVGARELTAQGSGTYIQITGGSARRGMPGRGPWASAAFATRGLLQAAAAELREHGVHAALLIVDATIDSEKTRGMTEGKPQEQSAGEDDVAAAVAYLAGQSPRAWTHELQLTPSGDRWVP